MRNVFSLASYHVLHRRLKRDVERLDALNASSPREFQAFQTESLERIVRHAYDHVGAYRDLYDQAGVGPGDLRALDDLARFPFVSKPVFARFASERRLADNVPETNRFRSETSGSGGEPFVFYSDRETIHSDTVAHNRIQLRAGWRPGDAMAYLKWRFPPEASRLKAALKRISGAQPYRIRTFDLKSSNVGRLIDNLRRRKTRFLQGYASSVHWLARHCEGVKGLGIRSIVTIAESMTDGQRAFVERVFGARVFMDYSASECMRVAFECPQRRGLHVDVGRYAVEIANPDSDGIGDVALTRLTNRVHPFVRYLVGDRAAMAHEPCACGLSTPRLVRLEGRAVEYVVAPNGKALTPAYFVTVFEHNRRHILRFQVRQISGIEILALLEVSQPLTPSEVLAIRDEIEGVTDNTIRVRIETVDFIPFDKNAKRPLLVPLGRDSRDR